MDWWDSETTAGAPSGASKAKYGSGKATGPLSASSAAASNRSASAGTGATKPVHSGLRAPLDDDDDLSHETRAGLLPSVARTLAAAPLGLSSGNPGSGAAAATKRAPVAPKPRHRNVTRVARVASVAEPSTPEAERRVRSVDASALLSEVSCALLDASARAGPACSKKKRQPLLKARIAGNVHAHRASASTGRGTGAAKARGIPATAASAAGPEHSGCDDHEASTVTPPAPVAASSAAGGPPELEARAGAGAGDCCSGSDDDDDAFGLAAELLADTTSRQTMQALYRRATIVAAPKSRRPASFAVAPPPRATGVALTPPALARAEAGVCGAAGDVARSLDSQGAGFVAALVASLNSASLHDDTRPDAAAAVAGRASLAGTKLPLAPRGLRLPGLASIRESDHASAADDEEVPGAVAKPAGRLDRVAVWPASSCDSAAARSSPRGDSGSSADAAALIAPAQGRLAGAAASGPYEAGVSTGGRLAPVRGSAEDAETRAVDAACSDGGPTWQAAACVNLAPTSTAAAGMVAIPSSRAVADSALSVTEGCAPLAAGDAAATPGSNAAVLASPAPVCAAGGLPVPCIAAVLDCLPLADLSALACVAKSWHLAVASSSSWRNASALQAPAFPAAVPRALHDVRLRWQSESAKADTDSLLAAPAPASRRAAAAGKATRGAPTATTAAVVSRGRRALASAASLAAPPVLPAASRLPWESVLGLPIYEVGAAFLRAFPWGSFLADGAYKQVWRVWNAAGRRVEAVSVMDVAALAPTGNLPVIATEIQVGCMLAELVRSHVCPNFVETHQVFLQAHAPHVHFPWWWGMAELRAPHGSTCPFTPATPSMTHARLAVSADGLFPGYAAAEVDCAHAPDSAKPRPGEKSARQSRKSSKSEDADAAGGLEAAGSLGLCSILSTFARFDSGELRMGREESAPRGRGERQCEPGLFQYIRMELCDGGDLETWLRAVEPVVLAAEARLTNAAVVVPAMADVGVVNEAEGRLPRERTRLRAPGAVAAAAPAAATGSEVDLAGAHLRYLDEAAATMFRSYLFQMAFSLYTARERFNLRHYDVKLLNFFLQSAGVSGHPGREGAADAPPRRSGLRYHLGPMVFELALGLPGSEDPAAALRPQHIVKLADYGTADVRATTLGLPIKPYHLTTLENVAPEMLYLGAACPQSFSTADTWALGLCAVHLLTGAAPYEELLSELHCPPLLRKEITRLWMAVPFFSVLRAVLADDTEGVLVNTLYRVLVLTADVRPRSHCAAGPRDSIAGAAPAEGLGQHARANPLCELLQFIITGRACTDGDASESIAGEGSVADVALPPAVRPSRATGKRTARAGSASAKQVRSGLPGSKLTASQLAALHRVYLEHAGEFSMRTGTNPSLARARRRMAYTEGATEAVEHLMQLDPQRRPTMLALLQAPLFTPLRAIHSLAGDAGTFYDCAAFSCDAATALANV